MVAGCVKHADFVVYENICCVPGREDQHDPLVFKFSYKPGARIQARAEEPPSGGALASGATEHAAAPAPNIPLHDSCTDFDKDRFVSKKLEADLISEADYGEAKSEHDEGKDGGASDAEDAPDAAEEAQLEEAEHFDELGCIGFALAKSVSLMGDIRSRFQNPEASAECLEAAWMKPLVGACSQAERTELSRCMEFVFTRRPLLQSTPQPKEDPSQARILKPAAEIEAGWKMIFEWRRNSNPTIVGPCIAKTRWRAFGETGRERGSRTTSRLNRARRSGARTPASGTLLSTEQRAPNTLSWQSGRRVCHGLLLLTC